MPFDEFGDFVFDIDTDIDTSGSDEDSEDENADKDDNSTSNSRHQSPSFSPSPTSVKFPSPPLCRIAGSVFTLDGPPQRVPFAHEDFDDPTNKPGVPLVNKILALEPLAQLLDDAKWPTPILVRRPRGCGLRTFTSMWSARLDVAQVSAVDPFIPLAIGAKAVKSSTATLHKFHILHLDLARVLGLTGDALRQYVYARLCEFIELYEFSLVLPEFLSFRNVTSGGMISYLAVKMDVELGGKRLYVIVENYESSKEKFSGELPEFYMELQCSIWTGSIAGVLYTAYIEDSASDHYADRDADRPVDLLPFRAPPSLDLTHHPVLQSAIGFTKQDIEDLDTATQDIPQPDARPLLDLVHERGGRPLRFSGPWTDTMKRDPALAKAKRKQRLPDVPVYPASLVLDALGQKCGCPNRIVE